MPYSVALLLVVIAAGSIAPATSLESWPEMAAEVRAGATFALHAPAVITLLERLITFLPLGLLIHRDLVRRRFGRASLWAGGAVLAFAVAIELLQVPVAGRHARLSDLVVALACGAGGILIGGWVGEPPARARVRLALIALLVAGNMTLGFAVVRGHRDAELSGWDCSYPLLIGNEFSGDRPWRGRIRGLAIYPRALSADEIVRLRDLPFGDAGAAVRRQMGSLLGFDFSQPAAQPVRRSLETAPVPDLSPTAPDAGAWQLPDRALEPREPLLLRSGAAPRELCQAVISSRAVSVEAEIASAGTEQGGPARIVSQSVSTLQRDFTLGQEGDALVFRVRTAWNGPNGTHAQLTAAASVRDGDWHHVVAVYARGVAMLFLDGLRLAPTIRYYKLMWLGETAVVPLAGFAGLGFIVLGLVAQLLTSGTSWPVRLACAYLGAALIPTAAGLGYGLVLGHDPDWWLIAAAIVGPPIGIFIGGRLSCRGHLLIENRSVVVVGTRLTRATE